MPMAFKIRSSKYRHIYGQAFRKEQSFENIRITRNAHDSNFCAVNPKFVAVVIESAGGGSFVVLPIDRVGRVDINAPKVCGHAGAVLDIKWNPFCDNIIASSSDDTTVKLWQLPDSGLFVNLTDWIVDLQGHSRRVSYLEWHPTAENILLSIGYDFRCFLWNVEQAEPVNVIEGHPDTIFSVDWNREGSLFASTCKDRKIRLTDPRSAQIVMEGEGHQGSKAAKVKCLANGHKLFTSGFSRMNERQYAIWDMRNMNQALKLETIDFSSGVILPFYDPDTDVMFLAGKGDGNIRYYEMSPEAPYIHYLNQYQSSSPQRGFGYMPKRGCDPSRCEIARFYKLHAAKNFVEPISMIVPRKSDQFQEDIFPPTAASIPSLRADEWISGQNRGPILVSLLDGALQQAPTITTYKAMGRAQMVSDNKVPLRKANSVATVPPLPQQGEPASVKNIKRLSSNQEYLTLSDLKEGGVKDRKAAFEEVTDKPPVPVQNTTTPTRIEKRVWSPTSPSAREFPSNGTPGPESEKFHVRKVWNSSPLASPPPSRGSWYRESPEPELKAAYFRQVEEIKSLQEQLRLKDMRIRQLEEELRSVRESSCGPGESNC